LVTECARVYSVISYVSLVQAKQYITKYFKSVFLAYPERVRGLTDIRLIFLWYWHIA